MQLTVIGTGTAAPHPDKVCSCYYLEHNHTRVLLDCGPGAVHHLARFGVPWTRLTHLMLTHFHNDHIGDVPYLFFALRHGTRDKRTDPLTVVGPAGTGELMEKMAESMGQHVTNPGFPIEIREIEPGDRVDIGSGIEVESCRPRHRKESLAYRVNAGGASIGYTGDTGPDLGLGDFFRGVDALLIECSLPDALAMDTHLTPSGVAEIARRAEPGCVLLTHIYPQLPDAEAPGRVREAGWSGEVEVAVGGMRLEF